MPLSNAPRSAFSRLPHPFVSTTPAQRSVVMENVNDPLWHRFLEEAERHFAGTGGLEPPRLTLFCHDGDLDEVMATVVLAYVRQDHALWVQVGDWLRAILAHYRQLAPIWRHHLALIAQGIKPPTAVQANLGQFFDSLVQGGGSYFVEGGLMIAFLHLYDMLEAYAPYVLSDDEKAVLEELLSDYATRYALHEEALKYSNRGLWANNGVFVSGLTTRDPERSKLLLDLSWRRYQEYRSTFFDDGTHHEGSMGYHGMAMEGIFYYALTAANVFKDRDCYGATERDERTSLYLGYPGYVDLARGYYRAAIPGKVVRQSPRGSSEYAPVSIAPCYLHAYALSGDMELGWMIRQRAGQVNVRCRTPMKVTPSEVLGLGLYEPLKSFWVYRPVKESRPPRRLDVLPEHGAFFSRSGWAEDATCAMVRFGYEGTGKGHRDHAHVTFSAGSVDILTDPFPRVGPKGNGSSVFHNTVTLDNSEPAAVIGTLECETIATGVDGFLISNDGGELPKRIFLHDPREDANRWFCNHPRAPDFTHRRAIIHEHGKSLVLVDQVNRSASTATPASTHVDWFFHSSLAPRGFDESAPVVRESYSLLAKNILDSLTEIEVATQGDIVAAPSVWTRVDWAKGPASASLHVMPLDGPMTLSFGVHRIPGQPGWDQLLKDGEENYFLRARQEGLQGRAIWVWSRDTTQPAPAVEQASDGGLKIRIGQSIVGDLSPQLAQLRLIAC